MIGGGVVGTSILWHLARAGRTDTVLIEKHDLTSGSTWHAAGNVPTFSNSWLGQRAGNYAWQLYSGLASDPAHPITYRKTKAFWPAHTRNRIDHFHHVLGISTGLGFDLRMISTSEMEAMHPLWRDDGTVITGLFDPYEGDIDPSGLTHSFARRARLLGARLMRRSEVVGIESLDRCSSANWRVHVERTSPGAGVSSEDKLTVDCDTVINAAGFYGSQVSALAGVEVPLAVLEHQYIVTEPLHLLQTNTEMFPLVRDPNLMFYLRREQDRLLFGNYGHSGRTVWHDKSPKIFDSSLFAPSTDDIAEAALDAALHVSLLEEAGVARFVNGPITYSPDANPLVGPAGSVRNFYQAVGVQVGVTQAAAVGKVLSELIVDGDTEWDVSSWDPRRFGDWALQGRGRWSYANARVRELYEHQYAEPFPHRIWKSARPVNKSPLYETLAAKGARFGQIAGWERAFWFGSLPYGHADLSYRDEHWHDAVATECLAVRDHVGVMDHPGFSRFEVSGPGAEAFLNRMFCTRLPALGRVRLAYMLRPNGTVWSEATVCRLAEDRFLLLGATVARERDFDWLQSHLRSDEQVDLQYGKVRTSTLMVMGPKSRQLLQRLTNADLSPDNAPAMSWQEMTVGGVDALGLRVSFVGELGWELHVDDDDLVALYDALFDAGHDLGIRDFGSYALNSMRIEKGYHGWGTEFGVEYTPFDVGLGRFVHFDKGDFVGRKAALAMSSESPEWSYGQWTLNLDDFDGEHGDPPPSAPILMNGQPVGFVTSAAMGFRTGQRVCLGYVQGKYSNTNSGFFIDIFGTPCPARRHTKPIYTPTPKVRRAAS